MLKQLTEAGAREVLVRAKASLVVLSDEFVTERVDGGWLFRWSRAEKAEPLGIHGR